MASGRSTTPTPSSSSVRAASPSGEADKLRAIGGDATSAAEQLQSWMKEPVTRDEVMGRTIPWDGYVRGMLLASQEVEMLRAYDKRDSAIKAQLISTHGVDYMHLFLLMLTKINTLETLQYIVSLISEVVEVEPDKKILLLLQVQPRMDPFVPLLSLVCKEEPDWYCSKEAYILLARMFNKVQQLNPEHMESMLQCLCKQLTKENPVDIRIAILALMKLVVRQEFRVPFCKKGGIQLLNSVIEHHMSLVKFQLLYEVVFCIWILCYEKTVSEELPIGTIANIVDVMKLVQKEKVQRVCIAALRNMISSPHNVVAMVSCGVHRSLPLWLQRKWGDQEINDDLEEIEKGVQKQLQEMSSFDVYKQEVLSRRLEWSPVHFSDKFWRENALRFEENKYEMLGTLHDIIKTSSDPIVLSVACHDLGEFVQYHPRGRSLINQMEVKEALMKLLNHTSPEVQKNALFSLQKMMAHKWDYVGS